MNIGIACDHGAFEYKEILKDMLQKEGHMVTDFGTYDKNSCDYPDFAAACAKSVAQKKNDFGIVICGTGIGVSISANKVHGIRCALCSEPLSAKLTREHNNANVLAIGAGIVGTNLALGIVDAFLTTKFSGEEKHCRRVAAMEALEEETMK